MKNVIKQRLYVIGALIVGFGGYFATVALAITSFIDWPQNVLTIAVETFIGVLLLGTIIPLGFLVKSATREWNTY